MSTTTENKSRLLENKSQRLLMTGKVHPGNEKAEIYCVEGDSGTYTVMIGSAVSLCSCPTPADIRCSHIAAAYKWSNTSGEGRTLLEEIRKLRQAAVREETEMASWRMERKEANRLRAGAVPQPQRGGHRGEKGDPHKVPSSSSTRR